MLRQYLLENWALILITIAFVILLKTTVFLEKKTIRRMCTLVALIFILSVVVFLEFYWNEQDVLRDVRVVLMAVRYSATPFIIAMILFAMIRKARWFVFVPAAVFAVINVISIFTGIVFGISDENVLLRGPLGYLPYVAVGLYSFFLVYKLFKQCNRQATEIIPIIFLAFAFIFGLTLPFVLGKDYSKIFCITIIIALFVYYMFSILQLTSKDALTGLLNRQAYYATVEEKSKNITGIVSIDMNGLKMINDKDGHAAGDEALKTLAHCFIRAGNSKQSVYRVGGDEFLVVCRRSSEEEIVEYTERINKNLSGTEYSCSIGYSCDPNGKKTIEEMVKESDKMMYDNKAQYYLKSGNKK